MPETRPGISRRLFEARVLAIHFVWVGKKNEGEYAQGVERYLARIRAWARIEVHVIRPEKERSPEAARREGGRILKALGEDSRVVVLAPEGKMKTSTEFSRMLAAHRDRNPHPIAFVVGGASGLSGEVLSRADELLSLSPLTFPHQIARLLLVEQVYRALSMSAGLRYH
jgi:23S rRNA (pseudouridine1915-N3)-methyltransferase